MIKRDKFPQMRVRPDLYKKIKKQALESGRTATMELEKHLEKTL